MILTSVVCLLSAFQSPTYADAWKYEQAARRTANAKIDKSLSREKILEGIRDLDGVLAYTHRPEIESMEDRSHCQAFILQRNDIFADQVSGYAYLKDSANVLRCIREIRLNFVKGSPATIAAACSNGSYYSRRLKTDDDIRALLPNAEIEAELRAIRIKDPNLRFSSYPYDIAETSRISETDRIAGLSLLWSEAKYNFANYDLDKELDWNEAYAQFLPQVRKAKDPYEYYNVLREFMAQLQDSHTDVALPPRLSLEKEVGVGLLTGLIDGKVVVLDTAPALKKQGISRGDVVETIEGLSATEFGRNHWGTRVSCSTAQDRQVRIFTYMLWRGPEGSMIRVGLRKADGSLRELSLRRTAKSGIASAPAYEFKILPDGTAYFAFNTCEDNAPSEAFAMNLDAIRQAGRLVIDVRSNGGGSSEVGYDILSHLIDRPVQASMWETPQYRALFRAWGSNQEPYKGGLESIEPSKDHFSGPVVALTSSRTFSAAEDFASACKTSGRVRLVGEPTAGSTGQPLDLKLPGGGYARICTKRDRYPDGTDFVGKGVLPDVEVRLTVAGIQQGRDAQLEEALRILSR